MKVSECREYWHTQMYVQARSVPHLKYERILCESSIAFAMARKHYKRADQSRLTLALINAELARRIPRL